MSKIEVSDISIPGFGSCTLSLQINGFTSEAVHNLYMQIYEAVIAPVPAKSLADVKAQTPAIMLFKSQPAPVDIAPEPTSVPVSDPVAVPTKDPEPDPVKQEPEPTQKASAPEKPAKKHEEPKTAKGQALTAKDLEGVKQRRDIVRRCLAKDITTLEEIVAACEAIQAESPALRPFKDMTAAIKPAFDAVMMENAAKDA